MKNIQQIIIDKIGIDKLLHFAFGGWLACFATTWFYALLIGFCIGLFKELIDKYIRKTIFDYWDWLATFSGSVITAITMIFFKLII